MVPARPPAPGRARKEEEGAEAPAAAEAQAPPPTTSTTATTTMTAAERKGRPGAAAPRSRRRSASHKAPSQGNTRKRSKIGGGGGGGGAGGEEEEEVPPICCYDWLDEESRIRVLSYLSPADLAEACLVSAQFNRDCFHGSLPRMEQFAELGYPSPPSADWYLYRGRPGTDMGRLRRQLHGMACRRSSIGRSIHELWILPPYLLDDGPPARRDADPEAAGTAAGRRPPASFVVPGITSLILSFLDHAEREMLTAQALIPHLPDLRHLQISGACSTWLTQMPFAEARERVRSLSFYDGFIGLSGEELSAFRCVTYLSVESASICIDDAVESPMLPLEDDAHPEYLFHASNQPLERVSFEDLTYCWGSLDDMPLPQGALVKFVRRTPTLKWFKSHLTPENVALLRTERPDVTFASWPAPTTDLVLI